MRQSGDQKNRKPVADGEPGTPPVRARFIVIGETIMFKEFKDFAMRGNVVDMAVGIIIGGAFVKDIIMPPIGMLMGNVDFSQLYVNLSDKTFESLAAAAEAGAPTINYGVFINTVLDFVIIAFAIFMVIKAMNSAKKKEEAPAAEPTPKKCPRCLSEIPIEATRCAHCTSDV